MQSQTGHICSIFLPNEFSNVFSNCLLSQMQSHIAHICTIFGQSEFWNVFLYCLLEQMHYSFFSWMYFQMCSQTRLTYNCAHLRLSNKKNKNKLPQNGPARLNLDPWQEAIIPIYRHFRPFLEQKFFWARKGGVIVSEKWSGQFSCHFRSFPEEIFLEVKIFFTIYPPKDGGGS